MKKESKDIRSIITKKMIEDALVKLLKTNNLDEITVKELCFEAKVNRSTFYNNFYDIYDVYDTISEEISNQIENELNKIQIFNYLDLDFIKNLIDYVKKMGDIIKVLLKDGINSPFLQKLIQYAQNIYSKTTINNKYLKKFDHKYLNDLFTFSIYGSLSLVVNWIYNDFDETTKSLATKIQKINYNLFK